jgi:hypothetical protein
MATKVGSVLKQAVINRIKSDTVLMGTYTNGKPNNDGLLTNLVSWRYDPASGQYVFDQKQGVYDYEIDFGQINGAGFKDIQGFIVVAGATADTSESRFATKGRHARDIVLDVRCYYKEDSLTTTPDTTFKEVESIAERVYELFHQKPLPIPVPADPANYTTWEAKKVTANGPIYIPAEQSKIFDSHVDYMVVTLNISITQK